MHYESPNAEAGHANIKKALKGAARYIKSRASEQGHSAVAVTVNSDTPALMISCGSIILNINPNVEDFVVIDDDWEKPEVARVREEVFETANVMADAEAARIAINAAKELLEEFKKAGYKCELVDKYVGIYLVSW